MFFIIRSADHMIQLLHFNILGWGNQIIQIYHPIDRQAGI